MPCASRIDAPTRRTGAVSWPDPRGGADGASSKERPSRGEVQSRAGERGDGEEWVDPSERGMKEPSIT